MDKIWVVSREGFGETARDRLTPKNSVELRRDLRGAILNL